ncbi:prolyl oligopeptidase family serine peptidase [Streptomyces sp. ACA25]|uniref:alpha/beta hydrolase family protein n=1 Tax=Streptomyces sp. ACA25 TaxID=3022596 RepID=UPI0023082D9B|nr:prolyl oligopeptidase family serine peptidase [Streptomyces sp. ACA25]MDB1089968.1 prolyl oligopeptidase family serine peptidase [Streptomyces sp. ACA25]
MSPTASASPAGWSVSRPVLPTACPRDPDLMVFAGDADGRCEIFSWHAGTGRARQVTDRAEGTARCAIDSDAVIWWFAEERDGTGSWQVQNFHGGPDSPALTGIPAGRPGGLAFGSNGRAAVGLRDEQGLTVHLGQRSGPAERTLRIPGHATLAGLSPREDLVAVARSAGSSRSVIVLTPDAVPTELDGEQGQIWALGFAPGLRTPELLLIVVHEERYVLATWTPQRGLHRHTWCSFDTEITACWYPHDRRVLVRQDRHGRSRLYVADPERRQLTPVPVPAGTVLDATPAADGTVRCLWTDTRTPPRVISTGDTTPRMPQAPAPPPLTARTAELWTPGPDGPVHTLLTLPERGTAPHPTVFLVHGGPAEHDRDAYSSVVHSLAASGLAVARVNYRGSTGYGPHWRSAFTEGVGHTQVADLVAVREELVRSGLARPDAIGLWGTSWGGYLVLLALGSRPALWQAGVAVKPVADCAAAYEQGTPALRALDTALFGGTPQEVPERYARSSPLSCATRVRAPLLVVAATRDLKCPPGQVRNYLAALRGAGVPFEELWLDSQHDGLDGAQHVEVLRRSLHFLARELHGSRAGRTRHPAPERR